MNLPERLVCERIDRMAEAGNGSFALYRLPWTDEPVLVLQADGNPDLLDGLEQLNGKRGFVLAPFHSTSGLPIVCIRPDYVVRGWDNIQQVLLSFQTSYPQIEVDDIDAACLVPNIGRRAVYDEVFGRFIASLRGRTFQKLVLSRCATTALPPDFSPLAAFVRACDSYPRMMVSLCHTPVTGTWIGSTPEIILSGHGTEWNTVALAGTMTVNGHTEADWTRKNREEQAYVSGYVRAAIRHFGCEPVENGPYTARAGQLIHLKTDFHFLLDASARIGDMLRELHPTPAVCGLPKAEAWRFIAEHEGYERAYYSGIIGWVDPDSETNLYVNLRCMRLSRGAATLYAGGGILPQSEADLEWAETEEKMNTMKAILSA